MPTPTTARTSNTAATGPPARPGRALSAPAHRVDDPAGALRPSPDVVIGPDPAHRQRGDRGGEVRSADQRLHPAAGHPQHLPDLAHRHHRRLPLHARNTSRATYSPLCLLSDSHSRLPAYSSGLGGAAMTLVVTGQLDLFADLDAAAERLVGAAAQRRAAEAPAIYGSPTRGYLARPAEFRAWGAEHGSLDCLVRSPGWRPEGGHHDSRPATEVCRPTILLADPRCRHHRRDRCLVGDLLARGAGRGCDREGPVRADRNTAVEDAHDHPWADWRDLPTVARRPQAAAGGRAAAGRPAGCARSVDDGYPKGWLAAGGAIRTQHTRYGSRHVPDHTGFGGYHLAAPLDGPSKP